MKKTISSNALMYSVGAFIIASGLLTKGLYSYLKNESWIGVILGFLISLFFVWMYGALARRFPFQSLIEINDAVFGRVIGKLISLFYLFFFLQLCFLNTLDLSDFVKSVILPQTPVTITLVFFILICAWAVKKGPINFMRYGAFFAIISIAALLFNTALEVNQMQPNRLLPVFTMPIGSYFMGAHLMAALPFCEIFAFFMLVPYLQKPDEFGKSLRRGLTIGAVIILVIVLRDISVLGDYVVVSTMPSFSVLRLIDIGDILTRLEIIYAFFLVLMLFFKVTVLYFAAVTCISRLFHFQSYDFLVLIIGALIVVYAPAVFGAAFEHALWNAQAASISSSFFLFFLPALTLIASSLRGISAKPEKNPS